MIPMSSFICLLPFYARGLTMLGKKRKPTPAFHGCYGYLKVSVCLALNPAVLSSPHREALSPTPWWRWTKGLPWSAVPYSGPAMGFVGSMQQWKCGFLFTKLLGILKCQQQIIKPMVGTFRALALCTGLTLTKPALLRVFEQQCTRSPSP